MPLARIRRLLADGGAKPLSAGVPLWELGSRTAGPWWRLLGRTRRYQGLQVEILEAAATLPTPLHLVIDGDPQAHDVGGTWSHAHERTYRVPDDCSLAALSREVLAPGDWTIYASHEAVDPAAIPDAFQVRPDQLALFAAAHGVALVIQAYEGNDPWRLWVEEVRTPQEAAA